MIDGPTKPPSSLEAESSTAALSNSAFSWFEGGMSTYVACESLSAYTDKQG